MKFSFPRLPFPRRRKSGLTLLAQPLQAQPAASVSKKLFLRHAVSASASGITFVGNLKDLEQSLAHPERSVITGDLVFATLNASASPGPQFTRLVPRTVTSWRKLRNARHMYLWVHNDLVAAVKNARVALAVDGLLRFGRRTKGRAIIFNGYRSLSGTYLHCYRFLDGELQDIQERVLPTDDLRYETEMTSLLNTFIEDDTKLYWTDPLPSLRFEKIVYIGAEAFQRIPLVTLARRAPAWQRFGPIALPAAALALYAGSVGYEWVRFITAHSNYEALASVNPSAAESLDVLRARQAWLAAPNPMRSRIAALPGLFTTLAVHPTWQIQKLQVNAPSKAQPDAVAFNQAGGLAVPDLQLTISIPRDDTRSPLDQAQGPLMELANATGLSLHVAAPPHGLTEQTTATGKLLYITIEASNVGAVVPPAVGQIFVGNTADQS